VRSSRVLQRVDLRLVARDKLPHPYFPIRPARNDPLVIGADRDGRLRAFRLAQCIKPRSVLDAPNLYRVVRTRARKQLSVGL
jgi:hypothetical protein